METLPSVELLSEVLECNIYEILPESEIIGSPKVIQYRTKNSFIPFDYINIYELAHKCKEWALGKYFVLYSGSTHKIKGYRCDIYTKDGDVDEDFVSDTEPEAIFKACEWIRTQIAS